MYFLFYVVPVITLFLLNLCQFKFVVGMLETNQQSWSHEHHKLTGSTLCFDVFLYIFTDNSFYTEEEF